MSRRNESDQVERRGQSKAVVSAHHTRPEDATDMFDLSGSLSVLIDSIRHHMLLVAIVCLFVICLAALYHYVWPPVYKAEAVVNVERTEDAQRDSFYKEWNLFRKEDARTETELMKSGSVLKSVIEREQLTYDDVYHPPLAQISYFWESSWLGRTYKSFKDWLLGPSELDSLTPEEKELGKTIRDLRSAVSIEVAGDVLIGKVYAKGPSPRIAHITNTLLDTYLEWRQGQHTLEARRALETLDRELQEMDAEIEATSRKRIAFLNEHSLVFDFSKETQEVEKLVSLEAEIAGGRSRLATLKATLDEIESQLRGEPVNRVVSTVTELNSVRETARQQYLELESLLIKQRNRYREDSPEIMEIKRDLSKLENLISLNPDKLVTSSTDSLNSVRENLLAKRSAILSELAGLEAGLEQQGTTAQELRERHQAMPALAEKLRDLDREFSVAQQVYKVLLTKRSQAAVSLAAAETTMSSLRVVDYASPPASQSWPKAKFLYPGALIVGLILGICAAIVKNTLNGRVYPRHLETRHSGLPMYATLDVRTDGAVVSALLPAGEAHSR